MSPEISPDRYVRVGVEVGRSLAEASQPLLGILVCHHLSVHPPQESGPRYRSPRCPPSSPPPESESKSSKWPPVVTSYASDSVVSALPACRDIIGRCQGVERSHWLVSSNSKVGLQTTSRNTETFLKMTPIP